MFESYRFFPSIFVLRAVQKLKKNSGSNTVGEQNALS